MVGVVTMDQVMVDCGPGADVRIGERVVLLGEQGDESITPDEWAAKLGTISYEVVCAIGARVARHYR
jgi:alanine racemase